MHSAILWLSILSSSAQALLKFEAPIARARSSPTRRNANADDDDCGAELSRRQALRRAGEAALTTAAVSGGLWLPSPSPPAAASEGAAAAVPTVKLGSLEISKTIQGCWQLAGGHGRYQESDAVENMAAHYRAGITTLDTADIYGPSEAIVGKFVSRQPGAVPITKFCCFRFLDEITRDEVKERIQRACERLQVAKLPLVQFFWSQYDVKRYVEVGLWLAELKDRGLIQEIGATNFDLVRLQELHGAGVPIVSHQVQCSALDRRPVQSGMASWCAENNVGLIAFGTVASGILSNLYLGKSAPSQAERNTASMRLYSGTAARFGDWQLVQELLRTMDEIAGRARSDGRCPGANISNVAQRYVLETPGVAAVLIGVRNQDHIEENVRTHSFQLTADERDAIDRVVAKREGPKGDVWDIERGLI
jgi:aryl-alcohol dehydrogenase-like predicted oxidoreductase